ncbi:hypothetical protein VTJ04DRAFT_7219 [Mycothermus thermophilus]|uniref:uncharacterized protein n=1 Tax=Humicola insolens TaxID=85995 RepID=UPI0037425DDA
MDEDQVPSVIVPEQAPRRSLATTLHWLRRIFLTKEGLIGTYDYGFLFRPNLPFMKKHDRAPPFFGLNDRMPVLLAILLGLQHALAMLAGIITPPLLLAGSSGANLSPEDTQYLVSTALIVSGLLSMIQITRFRILRTRYYIGTGLVSVVGISFSIIPVAQGAFAQMYANGFCPTATITNPDGSTVTTKLPCPDAYGAVLGTAAICALLEIALAFVPPRTLLRVLPPVVTGPTVLLIGVHLIETGFKNWAGGSGPCSSNPDPPSPFALCPNVDAPHALPWGSPEYLGLGLCVFVTILLCERFGSPMMKSTSVAIGLLVGCIVAAATGYFSPSQIEAAPAASFIWTRTFKLSVYGPLVLPLMAVYMICACEAIGDITATCDVSRLEVTGGIYESRIQGGVLADGVNGALAALATITPMTTFAQNNGVISLTRCANRAAGYCCCIFLIIAGIFAKTAAALVSIPSPVLGGMTTFLFSSVAVSGMAIVGAGESHGPQDPPKKPTTETTTPNTTTLAPTSTNTSSNTSNSIITPRFHQPQQQYTNPWSSRRNRFILTAALALGYGATLVPHYFDNVFHSGETTSEALRGLQDAVSLIMETGFAVAALVAGLLNWVLPADHVEDLAAGGQHHAHGGSGGDDEIAGGGGGGDADLGCGGGRRRHRHGEGEEEDVEMGMVVEGVGLDSDSASGGSRAGGNRHHHPRGEERIEETKFDDGGDGLVDSKTVKRE